MNLTKRLATYGAASRRKSAELIKAGRVCVNGEVQTNPGARVSPKDKVTLDGRKIDKAPQKYYIMLNKPRGYICTNEDIHAKNKAVDLINIKGNPRLFSCGRLDKDSGRLDKDSEGLIIFTNDGDFALKLEHPSGEILKTYTLSADHPFTSDELQKMCDGIETEEGEIHAEDIYQTGTRKYLVILNEGKNREIRRMAEFFGNDVKRLERTAIGNLRRGMLKPGEWRFMNRRDFADLFNLEPNDETLDEYAPAEAKPGRRSAAPAKTKRGKRSAASAKDKLSDYDKPQKIYKKGKTVSSKKTGSAKLQYKGKKNERSSD